MRVLGIETSTPRGEVAVATAGQSPVSLGLQQDLRHGRDLVPCIQRLLEQQGWPVASVEAVAVSLGPGSYTGLRVGLTCAKTFAYASRVPLVGVDSLEVVAANAGDTTGAILAVADAQRGELYCGRYRMERGVPTAEAPVRILGLRDAVALADASVRVVGPGLARYAADFAHAGCCLAPEDAWYPRAEWVARLGCDRLRQGHTLDVHTAEPIYMRRPAAVDKWEATHREV